MGTFFHIIFTTTFGYSVLRVTTPILFAALGALIADRSGAYNMGLEGTMLVSALTGVIVSAFTGSAWLGLLAAVIAGIAVGLVLAYFALNLKADIILVGIAINLMAGGGTIFALYLAAHDKGISTSLASKVLPSINIPILKSIPVLGPIFSGHNILTYVAILAVIVIHILLYKTALGLRIRVAGENSNAADSVGISVLKTRYIALAISGALGGFGGAYMSMGYVSWFSTNMTAGRGFIALAAEAMGMANPVGTFAASVLFGFADALSNSVQSLGIPTQFVQMIPYIATVLGLVLYAIRQQAKLKKVRGN